MQASPISINRCSTNDLFEIEAKLNEDFESKLIVKRGGEDTEEPKQEQEDEEVEVEVEVDEEAEEDFSFVIMNPDGSPVSADQAFQNGLIRPMYPLFNKDLLYESGNETLRPPLKKLFIEDRDSDKSSDADEDEVAGPYCPWSGKAVDASPENCKKSNSTGFSKLRRFRELVLRSNSDGKDAFVLFHNNNPSSTTTTNNIGKNAEKIVKKENVEKKTVKKVIKVKGEGKGKGKTAPSAHERHYLESKAMKEGDKHRSYLPYRVGLFTSVNGMSRNVHPF